MKIKHLFSLLAWLVGLPLAAQNTDGFCISGNCKDGFGKCKYLNPIAIYEGDFVNGKWEGKGTLDVTDNFVYKGAFSNHTMTGKATITYANGDQYEGDVINGKLDGQGKFTFASGGMKFYFGRFSNSSFNGYGEATYVDGIYEGQWVDSKRQGHGRYYNSQRELLYEGPWEADTATRSAEENAQFLALKKIIATPFKGAQSVTFRDKTGTVNVSLSLFITSELKIGGSKTVFFDIAGKIYTKVTGLEGTFDAKTKRLSYMNKYTTSEDWLPEGFSWNNFGQCDNFTLLNDNDRAGYFLLIGNDNNQNRIELSNFQN
jgi:hypothetical protein